MWIRSEYYYHDIVLVPSTFPCIISTLKTHCLKISFLSLTLTWITRKCSYTACFTFSSYIPTPPQPIKEGRMSEWVYISPGDSVMVHNYQQAVYGVGISGSQVCHSTYRPHHDCKNIKKTVVHINWLITPPEICTFLNVSVKNNYFFTSSMC